MKVLLCERSFSGHRKKYMECLYLTDGIEFFCFAPSNSGVPEDHFFLYDREARSYADYFWWINRISCIVRENNIDVIHFLDGDSMMRFMGLFFSKLRGVKTVTTYHHFYSGTARKISYRRISGRAGSIPVVHTDNLKKQFESIGLSNTRVCDYPVFDFGEIAGRDAAADRKSWGLSADIPTIGIIGGISSYKNISFFLETLNDCAEPFQLLVCGRPAGISAEEIESLVSAYEEKCVLKLSILTEEEYISAISASDIIYCIYERVFDGASGPLTDGVCAGKMILSCAHGSLGDIVSRHHLGLTAECDNRQEVLAQTELALRSVGRFSYDKTAQEYRESLRPSRFQQTYRKIYEES